jgi:CRP-like cAMP-binding protein
MNLDLLKKLKTPSVTVNEGAVVLKKGDKGSKVHVLIDGEVVVTAGGHEVARVATPGSVFGEISALLATQNVADVTTTTESSFYVIDDFMGYLKDNSDASVSVAQMLAVRLVNMNNHFVLIKDQLVTVQQNLENYLPVFPEEG